MIENIIDILFSEKEIEESTFSPFFENYDEFVLRIPAAIELSYLRLALLRKEGASRKKVLKMERLVSANIDRLLLFAFIKHLRRESLATGVSIDSRLNSAIQKERHYTARNNFFKLGLYISTILIGSQVFFYGVPSKFVGMYFILVLLVNGVAYHFINQWVDKSKDALSLLEKAIKELDL